MDIISEPAFTEKTVIDLDIAFATGVWPLTLGIDDTMFVSDGIMTVQTMDPPKTVRVNMSQVLWWTTSKRIVRTPVKPSTVTT